MPKSSKKSKPARKKKAAVAVAAKRRAPAKKAKATKARKPAKASVRAKVRSKKTEPSAEGDLRLQFISLASRIGTAEAQRLLDSLIDVQTQVGRAVAR